jgi:hypothetical protein
MLARLIIRSLDRNRLAMSQRSKINEPLENRTHMSLPVNSINSINHGIEHGRSRFRTQDLLAKTIIEPAYR